MAHTRRTKPARPTAMPTPRQMSIDEHLVTLWVSVEHDSTCPGVTYFETVRPLTVGGVSVPMVRVVCPVGCGTARILDVEETADFK